MKLRNKKTGEIVTFVTLEEIYDDELDFTYIKKSGNENELSYSSLKKFNDEWEDYKPAEPLIKDEKIRKAVRAWAEACGTNQVKYSIAPNQYYDADMGTGFSITFLTKPVEVYLEEGKIYTIAELCGEEEE